MASCLLRTWPGVHSQCMFYSFLSHAFSDSMYLLLVRTEEYLVRYMEHLLLTSRKPPSSVIFFLLTIFTF
jgi:hypothetical protein